MRYFIDTEFDGHGGALLSIAMIRDDGDSTYVRTFDAIAHDPWVAANVVPLLDVDGPPIEIATSTDNVGDVLRRFIGDDRAPTIIADSPVDIGRFCAVISTGPDGCWASADYPLMTFEVHNVDCYPTTLEGAVQHNAWWDAMALRHKLQPTSTDPMKELCEALEDMLELIKWLAGDAPLGTDTHRRLERACTALENAKGGGR